MLTTTNDDVAITVIRITYNRTNSAKFIKMIPSVILRSTCPGFLTSPSHCHIVSVLNMHIFFYILPVFLYSHTRKKHKQ